MLEQVLSVEEAKSKFLEACSAWADLLIDDSVKQVERGGARWRFIPAEMTPRFQWVGDTEPQEMPASQANVWRASYQLLLDAFDVAQGETDART